MPAGFAYAWYGVFVTYALCQPYVCVHNTMRGYPVNVHSTLYVSNPLTSQSVQYSQQETLPEVFDNVLRCLCGTYSGMHSQSKALTTLGVSPARAP